MFRIHLCTTNEREGGQIPKERELICASMIVRRCMVDGYHVYRKVIIAVRDTNDQGTRMGEIEMFNKHVSKGKSGERES